MSDDATGLQRWIDFAEKHGNGVSVTLFVRGVVVSGTIISTQKYMELMAEGFGRALIRKPDGSVVPVSQKEALPAPTGTASPIPGAIFLANVVVFAGGERLAMSAAPWRGQLSSVDGWAFGAFQV